jgi:hypothetical protein
MDYNYINKTYTSLNNIIFDNINNLNITNYKNEKFYFYLIEYLKDINLLNNNKNLRITITKKCIKKYLNSFGIKFKIYDFMKYDNIYTIKIGARVISKHKNLHLRLYDGYKWHKNINKLKNSLEYFDIDFKYNDKFNKNFRISINNDDVYSDNDDVYSDNDYIIEFENIKIIDNEINKTRYKNKKNFNFYFCNTEIINICKQFRSFFVNKKDIYGFKITLNENIDMEKNFTDNDILFVRDIHKKSNLYKNYKDIFNKFIKNNIIWYNFESPYINWFGEQQLHYFKNFGIIYSSFLKNGKKPSNCIWGPLKSSSISDFSYKDYQIKNMNFNNLIVSNPFTHSGYGSYKFGNRENIIKTFLDNNIDVHLYGKKSCLQQSTSLLKTYYTNYKGSIGKERKRTNTDFGISKINKLSEYKFIIVIENIFQDGYISEKLSDVLLCNRIIIYFGGPTIHKMFPELFTNGIINGFTFESISDIINFINNMSDDEYYQRIKNIEKARDKILNLFNEKIHIHYILSTLLVKKNIDIKFDKELVYLQNKNKKIKNLNLIYNE